MISTFSSLRYANWIGATGLKMKEAQTVGRQTRIIRISRLDEEVANANIWTVNWGWDMEIFKKKRLVIILTGKLVFNFHPSLWYFSSQLLDWTLVKGFIIISSLRK